MRFLSLLQLLKRVGTVPAIIVLTFKILDTLPLTTRWDLAN